MQAPFQAI